MKDEEFCESKRKNNENARTKVYIVRHGFNPANNAGYNGQHNIREKICQNDEYMPLDEYGKQQAAEVGQYLSEKIGGRRVLVIVSPYYRTRETAYILLNNIPNEQKQHFIIRIVDSIREINQGLEYAQPKDIQKKVSNEEHLPENVDEQYIDKYVVAQSRCEAAQKGHNPEVVPYCYGESIVDVARRLRVFSRKLKQLIEEEIYNDIVIVSHSTVIRQLYNLLTGESLQYKTNTGSLIELNGYESLPVDEYEARKRIFTPDTIVPKGYMVDYTKFDNYRLLYLMQQYIDAHNTSESPNKNFNKFLGDRKTIMPLEEQCIFIEKPGETLVILPGNTQKKGMFFIDASKGGQDRITHDCKSKSTYFVTSGTGTFYIRRKLNEDFEKRMVKEGDSIVIPPNTIFYYEAESTEKGAPFQLMEKMEPDFSQENIVDHGPTPRFKKSKEADIGNINTALEDR